VIRAMAVLAGVGLVDGCASNDTNGGDDGDDDDTDDTETDDTDDTDVTSETDLPGTPQTTFMTIEVTPDNGVAPYTLTFDFVLAGWPDTYWGFLGGNQPSTALGFFFEGDPSGVGSYPITADGGGPNIGSFTDPVTFGAAGGFLSQSGTVEVTRWDENPGVPGAYEMDGTLSVHMSNEYPGNLIEADITGEFGLVSVVEGSPFR
jgi:hypothetical protein